ncbi:polysaccharide pyruvyl transferase family protein [Devosia chinhatensis]|uniref:Polysaccharide pyruvyl transferase domain-containing protein n=1 Tax=Devosia chinhatensis TaxID=429727 RepID=A0A0F5FNM8_9HYPH|nr:polysaccharide pyruvyl transferase family protein [Devosia chinhatensis]KKB09792.1 hypothetical protein VE26_08025 [Devosia chinhatensis]
MGAYVVYGAFGGLNAGDEMILRATVQQITSRDRQADINVLPLSRKIAPEAAQDYVQAGWRCLRSDNWRALFGVLSRADLVIAGGQLLNGRPFPKSLIFLFGAALLARASGRRVLMVGTGSRDVSKFVLSRFLVRVILWLCTFSAVRDDATLRDLQTSGVKGKYQPHLTADVVWTLGTLGRQGLERRTIVFAVHRDPGEIHAALDRHLQMLASLREAFPDYSIAVAAHDWRDRFDGGLVADMHRAAPTMCVPVLLHSASDAEALYEKAAVVVSSRMHPLIIGSLCGASIVPIASSTKVDGLARHFNLEPITWNADRAALTSAVHAALTHQPRRNPDIIRQLQARSMLNFSWLGHGA